MPKRKSESDKKKEGTARQDRNKVLKKSNLVNYPDPGQELTEEETAIFRRVCDHLKAAEALMDVDAYQITALSKLISARNDSFRMLAKDGLVQEFDNGTKNLSPAASLVLKLSGEIRQMVREFGMTPKARQDMSIFIDTGEAISDDPADEWM